MKGSLSKLFYLLELLCFVAAVFLIAGGKIIPGVIAFIAGVCLPRVRAALK